MKREAEVGVIQCQAKKSGNGQMSPEVRGEGLDGFCLTVLRKTTHNFS
jgi:hypothetical protein